MFQAQSPCHLTLKIEKKERILRYHSERIAVAFALISMPAGCFTMFILDATLQLHVNVWLPDITILMLQTKYTVTRYNNLKDKKMENETKW
jgi:hypothetical protein